MHWNMIFICWGFRGKKSTASSNWNGSPCTGMHLQKKPNRGGRVCRRRCCRQTLAACRFESESD